MKLKIKSTIVFQKNWAAKTRYICNEGGARSSKTFSIAQKYILKLLNCTGKVLTITRKTGPSLTSSVMRDFFDILRSMGLYSVENHNKSDKTYSLHGNIVEFVSMDDPHKKRGAQRNWLWMNEATEFTYEDFMQFNMRTTEEVTIDYNPSEEYHWIYEKVATKPDCTFIPSTYKDNPFLPASLVQVIEALEFEDPEYWKVYGMGERAKSTSTIYTNWDIVPAMPAVYDDIIYGMDFGFNNPSVLLEIRIKDSEAYIRELIYASKLTNGQLIEEMRKIIPEENLDCIIKADSAEPARIQEIWDAGFNIIAAEKGPGSVKLGIDRVKRMRMHITEDSVNTKKEIKGYKWKIDRDGHILDEPVRFMDHSMSSIAYAIGLDGQVEKFKTEEVATAEDLGQEIEVIQIGDY